MHSDLPPIIYTKTDEAPALATFSFFPIVQAFLKGFDIPIEMWDISLAGRILAIFPEALPKGMVQKNDLEQLGDLAKRPEANIIKLPNISASIPQLKAAITELQKQGFTLPNYPDNPKNDQETQIKKRYDAIKGSAVNPVLREGNSDRRAPACIKNYVKKHPHSLGDWSPDSRTHVSSMSSGDFFGSEQSQTLSASSNLSIVHQDFHGKTTVLKSAIPVLAGDIIDAAVMSRSELKAFFKKAVEEAREEKILLSLHLKATMMKISDPIIFGYAVEAYFASVFAQFSEVLASLGVDVRNGFGDLLSKIQKLPEGQKAEIEAAIDACFLQGPDLAMVNSDEGITNLHVPSDVIIDASMPAAIRSAGKMWGADGALHDTKAVIPDRCYAGVYQACIEFFKQEGSLNPAEMGSVPNVGLMAQKAEEYGSHDKTFEISTSGEVQVINNAGEILLQHSVEEGDIWRMCLVGDSPVQDWVKLAVKRARASHAPAVFWLDSKRPHDQQLIKKVENYLKDHDTQGLDIQILSPVEATKHSLQRMKAGLDTISVTGNVLRDYLTDLFPILELGTSAKMLSVVPLMNGGGLFETGAGGSAPKHVQQLLKEDYLRWDSLGEFLALAESLEHFSEHCQYPQAKILARTLSAATEDLLENDKSPSRRVGGLDNRGSHFYLALYWAKALASDGEDNNLSQRFDQLAKSLQDQEAKIVAELKQVQGCSTNIGGYYHPKDALVSKVMRPSTTLNTIIDTFNET